jgi:hypothetical protein
MALIDGRTKQGKQLKAQLKALPYLIIIGILAFLYNAIFG